MEAQELLGSFDGRLRQYAARKLTRAGVHLVQVGLAAFSFETAEWQNLLMAGLMDGAARSLPAT